MQVGVTERQGARAGQGAEIVQYRRALIKERGAAVGVVLVEGQRPVIDEIKGGSRDAAGETAAARGHEGRGAVVGGNGAADDGRPLGAAGVVQRADQLDVTVEVERAAIVDDEGRARGADTDGNRVRPVGEFKRALVDLDRACIRRLGRERENAGAGLGKTRGAGDRAADRRDRGSRRRGRGDLEFGAARGKDTAREARVAILGEQAAAAQRQRGHRIKRDRAAGGEVQGVKRERAAERGGSAEHDVLGRAEVQGRDRFRSRQRAEISTGSAVGRGEARTLPGRRGIDDQPRQDALGRRAHRSGLADERRQSDRGESPDARAVAHAIDTAEQHRRASGDGANTRHVDAGELAGIGRDRDDPRAGTRRERPEGFGRIAQRITVEVIGTTRDGEGTVVEAIGHRQANAVIDRERATRIERHDTRDAQHARAIDRGAADDEGASVDVDGGGEIGVSDRQRERAEADLINRSAAGNGSGIDDDIAVATHEGRTRAHAAANRQRRARVSEDGGVETRRKRQQPGGDVATRVGFQRAAGIDSHAGEREGLESRDAGELHGGVDRGSGAAAIDRGASRSEPERPTMGDAQHAGVDRDRATPGLVVGGEDERTLVVLAERTIVDAEGGVQRQRGIRRDFDDIVGGGVTEEVEGTGRRDAQRARDGAAEGAETRTGGGAEEIDDVAGVAEGGVAVEGEDARREGDAADEVVVGVV